MYHTEHVTIRPIIKKEFTEKAFQEQKTIYTAHAEPVTVRKDQDNYDYEVLGVVHCFKGEQMEKTESFEQMIHQLYRKSDKVNWLFGNLTQDELDALRDSDYHEIDED